MLLARTGAAVALDASALAALKKASPKPDSIVLEAAPEAAALPSGPALSRPQARAAVAARAASLLAGASGVRAPLVEFLAALLNAGVVPALPAADADADCLAALADAASGAGSLCAGPHDAEQNGAVGAAPPLAPALEAAGLAPPGVRLVA